MQGGERSDHFGLKAEKEARGEPKHLFHETGGGYIKIRQNSKEIEGDPGNRGHSGVPF